MQLPERRHIASFDVDAQRTFTPICPEELPVTGGDHLAPALNAQAGYAAWRIGSKDAHSPEAVWVTDDPEKIGQSGAPGDNVEQFWPVHAVPGTDGFELIPGLPRPAEYDFFVWKGVELDMHPDGACFHDRGERMSTGVIEWLRSHEVSHVLVGGLATDVCVKMTARQLQDNGFQVILNRAATRGITAEGSEEAVAELKQHGVHIIEDLGELVTAA